MGAVPVTDAHPTTVLSQPTTASVPTPIITADPRGSTVTTEADRSPNSNSVLAVNAATLFQQQAGATGMVHEHSISRHVSEKTKCDVWANVFVGMSSLLPETGSAQLALNILETEGEPVLRISSTPKPKCSGSRSNTKGSFFNYIDLSDCAAV
ncbi:hypothetical protein SNE40_001592 [Patella caerulea]|uniref:Uncharacterized protein n=1 Tax=Patella caerulea TaxID=87958 RepID=A0AAN8KNJ7_PATCE